MNNLPRKIQQNIDDFVTNQYYKNMTPEMYKAGIQNAVKAAEEKLTREYDTALKLMGDEYNKSIRDNILMAMDTLAVEMIYELGNVLECYVDEPEYLDQKIDIVQNIYEKAMDSIRDYATDKYKNSKQAQQAFEKKKKKIQKIFGMKDSDYNI